LGVTLRAITALVTRFPATTLIVSVLLAAAAMGLAQSRLKFHTSRSDLLDPHSEYHHRWLEYTEEFGGQEDVVVVVQGKERQAVVPVIDELAGHLLRAPSHFRSVFYKMARPSFKPRAFTTWRWTNCKISRPSWARPSPYSVATGPR